MQSLNDSGFSVVTDFVILVPDEESNYVLYDVYNSFKLRGGILNITRLGTWSKEDGLKVVLLEPKIIRRRNFHGIRTKAAGIVSFSSSKYAIYQTYGSLKDVYGMFDASWTCFGLHYLRLSITQMMHS